MAMLSSKEKKNSKENGVIIRYYVELVNNRSKKQTKTKEYVRNEYDRRAQLLAHSRYLRKPASETVSLPVIQPKSKFISYQPVRICSCSASMETVPSLTIRSRNELKEKKEDRQSEKKKFNEKYSPLILGKMNHLWKQVSCKGI
ncbi:unnamed protein product [Vicia faba]|uniref:Uncharacterized protein n=1 Tax=Vicia faba TaxID=3906 RepID=A0AAV0ZHQ0_VICFA|nr:unnamed protein product [Vicia faba]